MATTTVNALTALTSADSGDKIPIWDISAGQYKAITKSNLLGGTLALTAITLEGGPSAAAFDVLYLNPRDENAPYFHLSTAEATFYGVVDTTYRLGFNYGATRDATKTSLYFQWETHYQYTELLSRSEFWLGQFQPNTIPGTPKNYRPWQVNVSHQIIDDLRQFWNAIYYQWYLGDPVTDPYMALTANTLGLEKLGIAMSNNYAVSAMVFAGTGWYNMLKLNTSDQVEVGSTAALTLFPGNTQFKKSLRCDFDNSMTLTTRIRFLQTDSLNTQSGHEIRARHTNSADEDNMIVLAVAEYTATTQANVLAVTGNKRVGVNDIVPDGTLHVKTPSTAAVPVLLLEQLDVSEPFLSLVGASTTDNSQSLIDAVNLPTPGAIVGWAKIYVEDVQGTAPITDGVYWIPFYSTPTT